VSRKKVITPKQMQYKLNKIINHLSDIGDVADTVSIAARRIPKGNPEETLPRRKDEIEIIIEEMDKFGVNKSIPRDLNRLIDLHDAIMLQEEDTLKQFMAVAGKIKEVAPELTLIVDQNIEAAKLRITRRR
jgi:hypothetical protein